MLHWCLLSPASLKTGDWLGFNPLVPPILFLIQQGVGGVPLPVSVWDTAFSSALPVYKMHTD